MLPPWMGHMGLYPTDKTGVSSSAEGDTSHGLTYRYFRDPTGSGVDYPFGKHRLLVLTTRFFQQHVPRQHAPSSRTRPPFGFPYSHLRIHFIRISSYTLSFASPHTLHSHLLIHFIIRISSYTSFASPHTLYHSHLLTRTWPFVHHFRLLRPQHQRQLLHRMRHDNGHGDSHQHRHRKSHVKLLPSFPPLPLVCGLFALCAIQRIHPFPPQIASDEVVQLYVTQPQATVPAPSLRLAAFERVTLKPGEHQQVGGRSLARNHPTDNQPTNG
jgi:hypothetical protein